jgi:xylulokinase
VGAGVWPDVPAACAATIKIVGQTLPDKPQIEAYRRWYPHYQALYPALKPTFDGLAV